MNTISNGWKVVILTVAIVLAIHLWPVLTAPLLLIALTILGIAGVAALLIGVTSPIWIPVLLIVGLVKLCRRPPATTPA